MTVTSPHNVQSCDLLGPTGPLHQANIRRQVGGRGGGGGGRSGTQEFVSQKWPDRIFLNYKFRFFPQWSLWSGGEGGSRGGGSPLMGGGGAPLMVVGRSNVRLPSTWPFVG